MRMSNRTFWEMIMLLGLIIFAMLALGGCSHTTALTTQEIGVLDVVTPEATEVVDLVPVADHKLARHYTESDIVEEAVAVPPAPAQTHAYTDALAPTHWTGKSKNYTVDIDLPSGRAIVTKAADTAHAEYVKSKTEITKDPEPSLWDKIKTYVSVTTILAALGALAWALLRR